MLFGWCLICWIFNFNIICVILLWLWLLSSLVYGSRVNKWIALIKVSRLFWFVGAAAVLFSSVCCTETGWISHINREQYCVTELYKNSFLLHWLHLHDSSPIFLVVVAFGRQERALVVIFLVMDLQGKQRDMERCPQGQFKTFLGPGQKRSSGPCLCIVLKWQCTRV